MIRKKESEVMINDRRVEEEKKYIQVRKRWTGVVRKENDGRM